MLTTHRVHGAVVHAGEEPRPDASTRLVVPGGRAPDRHEHLLEHVLGERLVAHHPVREPERRAPVPAEELGERVLAPARDAGEQIAIAPILEVGDLPPDRRRSRMRFLLAPLHLTRVFGAVGSADLRAA